MAKHIAESVVFREFMVALPIVLFVNVDIFDIDHNKIASLWNPHIEVVLTFEEFIEQSLPHDVQLSCKLRQIAVSRLMHLLEGLADRHLDSLFDLLGRTSAPNPFNQPLRRDNPSTHQILNPEQLPSREYAHRPVDHAREARNIGHLLSLPLIEADMLVDTVFDDGYLFISIYDFGQF